jgi:hypothetical protein
MLFFLKTFAQKTTIGAVKPLPANRVSGFVDKQIRNVLKKENIKKRGSGLSGAL